MGTIFYGGTASPIHVDDRVLAHLKVVITTKLRRGESLTLSWPNPDGQVAGVSTIWLNPAVPLMFVFAGPDHPELDKRYLVELANSANSTGGIHLCAENLAQSSCPSRKSLPASTTRSTRSTRAAAAK